MIFILKIVFSFSLISFGILAYSDELEIRNSIRDNSRNLLLKENFSEIEKLFQKYNFTKEETPSGALKINLFTDGLASVMLIKSKTSSESEYLAKEDFAKKWLKLYPNSISAHMFYAGTFTSRAWRLRGEGLAHTVTDEAWDEYYKYLNLQNDYYDKHKDILSGNILWYLKKLENRKNLSKQSEFNSLFEEAKSKNLQDMRLYSAMISSFSPFWGGNAEKIDDFINLVVKDAKIESKDYLYSRLYAIAEQDIFPHQLFEKSKADWPKMKRGFEERLTKYPDVWNENVYAHYSCQAKDKGTTRKLMLKIGNTPALTVWQPNGAEWFNYCRNWATNP